MTLLCCWLAIGRSSCRESVYMWRCGILVEDRPDGPFHDGTGDAHLKETMPPIIWIDGTYHDRASAKVSVFDHGLLYGDGVFEGIRVYNRRVFRLGQHLDRLFASAKGVWLEIPLAKPAMHRMVEE